MSRTTTLDASLSLESSGEAREDAVDRQRALDRFLAGIKRRALHIAQMMLRDRVAAHARFNTWRTLPPAERERLRERWTRILELTSEQIDRRPCPPC